MDKTIHTMCPKCGANLIPDLPGDKVHYHCEICHEHYERMMNDYSDDFEKEQEEYWKKINKLDKKLAFKIKINEIKHRLLSLLMPIWIMLGIGMFVIIFTSIIVGIIHISLYILLSIFQA